MVKRDQSFFLEPGDVVFQVIVAGGRQRVTPLWDALTTAAKNASNDREQL